MFFSLRRYTRSFVFFLSFWRHRVAKFSLLFFKEFSFFCCFFYNYFALSSILVFFVFIVYAVRLLFRTNISGFFLYFLIHIFIAWTFSSRDKLLHIRFSYFWVNISTETRRLVYTGRVKYETVLNNNKEKKQHVLLKIAGYYNSPRQ